MYKDVTPRSFDLGQHKRAQKQPTDMQRALKKAELERLRKEVKRIEAKITNLCAEDAAPEIISRWQDSKLYTVKLLEQKEAA